MVFSDNVSTPMYSRAEIDSTLSGVQGNRVIGTLDDELVTLFVLMCSIEIELEELDTEIRKRFLARATKSAIDRIDSYTPDQHSEVYRAVAETGMFESEAEASNVYRLLANYERVRATFWYDVRITFNVWNEWLEIRQGFRVVSNGKKYEKPS